MVFFGEYEVSFSAPGRIVLPKRIRELLKGGVVVLTKGFDECIAGYDHQDWERRAKELLSFSLLEKENLEKRRFLFGSTMYVDIDEQGRFVIPKHMIDYAQLNKKAIIIGVGDHFEIWETERWKEYVRNIKD